MHGSTGSLYPFQTVGQIQMSGQAGYNGQLQFFMGGQVKQ